MIGISARIEELPQTGAIEEFERAVTEGGQTAAAAWQTAADRYSAYEEYMRGMPQGKIPPIDPADMLLISIIIEKAVTAVDTHERRLTLAPGSETVYAHIAMIEMVTCYPYIYSYGSARGLLKSWPDLRPGPEGDILSDDREVLGDIYLAVYYELHRCDYRKSKNQFAAYLAPAIRQAFSMVEGRAQDKTRYETITDRLVSTAEKELAAYGITDPTAEKVALYINTTRKNPCMTALKVRISWERRKSKVSIDDALQYEDSSRDTPEKDFAQKEREREEGDFLKTLSPGAAAIYQLIDGLGRVPTKAECREYVPDADSAYDELMSKFRQWKCGSRRPDRSRYQMMSKKKLTSRTQAAIDDEMSLAVQIAEDNPDIVF